MRFSAVCLGLVAALVLCGRASAAGTVYAQGGGNGHGIGMSQYGAEGYALHGRDHRFILAHYYSGTQLGTLASGRVVRVLLSDGSAAFAGAATVGTTRLNPSLTYVVHPQADGSLVVTTLSG